MINPESSADNVEEQFKKLFPTLDYERVMQVAGSETLSAFLALNKLSSEYKKNPQVAEIIDGARQKVLLLLAFPDSAIFGAALWLHL